ncbi:MULTISPECIES: AbfB domain-containing protein [unclassified Crossiella]|uniref:AbfB domain-containing protein n=1 Tax=unclassified Crossiella TaxID=2620835 RepID=UPI001FFF7640|nr:MULTISPECIES: AbfB domain-containing protein [unclassified Crossiella]MCK2237410.1 AbfB domain-containing protein [Crossiella sp. S99.2]MCK2251065.1 AbfB domain-containing protein [Crossiella sp. S99.1]
MNRSLPVSVIGVLAAGTAAVLLAPASAQALSNGSPTANGAYSFTARLQIGGRACSGALVDPQWVVTAASCFVADPAQGIQVPPGAPQEPTTVTFGTGASQLTVEASEVAARQDRDLAMVKLANPVNTISPLALSTTAPKAGDKLRVSGYGRTRDQWRPDPAHTAVFTVDSVDSAATSTSLPISGSSSPDASTCQGDSGGPAFRETDGRVELVAVNSTSYEFGCMGETGTRKGAVEARADNVTAWITERIVNGRAIPGIVPGAIVDFRGVHSGRCLDVYFASWENDARTVIANCHGRANQQWEVIERAQNVYSLKSLNAKKCLEVTGAATHDGAPIGQFDCRADLTRQQWELVPAKDNTVELRNKATGKVIQPTGAGAGEGTVLVQAENRHTSDQQWSVRVVGKARHDLVNPADPNRSLRVTNDGLANHYARHANGLGWIEVINENSPELNKADATWRILPGLADGSCYSIAAVNVPNAYLRHAQGRIRLDNNDGSALLAADATWCARDGLSGRGVSLESWNLPDRFIRHAQGQLWSAQNGGGQWWENPESFAADTSWEVVAPLKK